MWYAQRWVLLMNELFPQNQQTWNPVSKEIFPPDSPIQSIGSSLLEEFTSKTSACQRQDTAALHPVDINSKTISWNTLSQHASPTSFLRLQQRFQSFCRQVQMTAIKRLCKQGCIAFLPPLPLIKRGSSFSVLNYNSSRRYRSRTSSL